MIVAPLTVLHISAARYRAGDHAHATFEIWRQLAPGFRRYYVVARSLSGKAAVFREGNIVILLLPSGAEQEAEFLFSQFLAMRLTRRIDPDVIVCQSPVLGGLVGAMMQRIGRPRGLLVELHGEEYVKRPRLFTKHGLLRRLAVHAIRRATRIRSLSPGMSSRIVAEYGAAARAKTVEVPVRVDLSRFQQVKQTYATAGRPVIAIVGSINDRKGQLRLLTAIAEMLDRVSVWVVGSGPDEQRCRDFLRSIGRTESVVFVGQVGHAQLAELLPKADALVCFSSSEATPRAVLEGMAVGLPVVATDVGFVADLFDSEEQGILLGSEPNAEIVTTLQRLLSDEALRARLGRAARVRVERDFESEAVYTRYRKLVADTAGAA